MPSPSSPRPVLRQVRPVVSAVQQMERLETLRELELAKAQGRDPWRPYPHQVAPPGDWYLWMLLAGRGAGKTDACASYFDRWMRQHPGARGSIIAPTLGDAFEACIYGPSGLLVHNPAVRVRSRPGGTIVEWPNESVAKLFGTHSREDVERLRAGGNRGLVWCEELAAWRYLTEAWEQMEFGLRVGPRPHVIASTTPKPRAMLKKLMESPETVVSRASTFDNPKLPEDQRERVRLRYEGTRLARQELFGEYIEEVEGALWSYDTLEKSHAGESWDGTVPSLSRVVVGVDPSGGDEEGNDEQGIVVAGRGVDGFYYVLADQSCKLSPDGWGKRVCQAYEDHKADAVLWEANFGGQMVESTVKIAARGMGMDVNTKKVSASRGKVARAEPVAALYEQGKVRHVGSFDELEGQMRNWTPDSGWSPDRMDAMVWALSELALGPQQIRMRTFVPRGRLDGGPAPARQTTTRRTGRRAGEGDLFSL